MNNSKCIYIYIYVYIDVNVYVTFLCLPRGVLFMYVCIHVWHVCAYEFMCFCSYLLLRPLFPFSCPCEADVFLLGKAACLARTVFDDNPAVPKKHESERGQSGMHKPLTFSHLDVIQIRTCTLFVDFYRSRRRWLGHDILCRSRCRPAEHHPGNT